MVIVLEKISKLLYAEGRTFSYEQMGLIEACSFTLNVTTLMVTTN
jgi:hypothetical protein